MKVVMTTLADWPGKNRRPTRCISALFGLAPEFWLLPPVCLFLPLVPLRRLPRNLSNYIRLNQTIEIMHAVPKGKFGRLPMAVPEPVNPRPALPPPCPVPEWEFPHRQSQPKCAWWKLLRGPRPRTLDFGLPPSSTPGAAAGDGPPGRRKNNSTDNVGFGGRMAHV